MYIFPVTLTFDLQNHKFAPIVTFVQRSIYTKLEKFLQLSYSETRELCYHKDDRAMRAI